MAKGCGVHRKKYAEGMVPAEDDSSAPVKEVLAPIVAGVTQNTGLTGQAAGATQNYYARQNAALAELAHGAVAIKGPGTGTSDSIHGVSLSKGESVLPAATTRALGAKNIARMIKETNGKAPSIGARVGGKHADGVVPAETFTPQQWAIARAAYPGTTNPRESIENIRREDPVKLQQLSREVGGPPAIGATAPAPTAPAAQPITTAPPAQPAPSAALGARAPTAEPVPAPAPQIGATGENYLRNEQTGATYKFKSADQAAAPAAQSAAPAASADPVRAMANEIMQNQPGVSFSSAMQSAAQTLGRGSESALRSAQTTALTQETALEQEATAPTTTPARAAQIRSQQMSKKGDVWMPYQAKDSLGLPVGETLLYNRATGETKPMEGGPAQGAQQRPVGTKSTISGKSAVWDGKAWIPQ